MSIKSNKINQARFALAAAVRRCDVLAATAASAGECPADKRLPDGTGQKPGATAPRA